MSHDRSYDQYASYYQQHPEHNGRTSYGEPPPSSGSYQGGQYHPLSAYQNYTPQNTLPSPNSSSNTFNNERSTGGNRNANPSAPAVGIEYTRGYIPPNPINHGLPNHAPITESSSNRYAPNSAAQISRTQQRNDPKQHVQREDNQAASLSLPRYVSAPRYMTDHFDPSAATTNYQQAEMSRGGQSSHNGNTYPTSQTSQHLQESSSPQPGYQQMRSANGEEFQQVHSREPYRNMPPTTNTSTLTPNGQNPSSHEHSGNFRYNAPHAQTPSTNMYQSSSKSPLSGAPRIPSERTSTPSALGSVPRQTQRDHQPIRQVSDNSHVKSSSQNQISMPQQSPVPNVRTSQPIPSGSSSETTSRPTTVDPRSVSNHQEHQKRQNAETGKRRAEDAMNTAGDDRSSRISNQSHDQEVPPSSRTGEETPSSSAPGMKDQMEFEMKQMLDRMREYKAKDPTLFSQIWEQVKKGQPSQAISAQAQALAASASPNLEQAKFPSPPVHVSPERAETELQTSFPPGFDRGRFPYQRRRRGGRVAAVASRQNTPGDELVRTGGKIPPLSVNGQSQTGSTLQTTLAPVHRDTPDERLMAATNEPRENPDLEKRAKPPTATKILAAKERDLTDERLVAAMTEFNKSFEAQEKARKAAPLPPLAQTLPPRPPVPTGSSATAAGQANAYGASPRPQSDIRTSGGGSLPKIGSTLWPEHKKEALAASAANILNGSYGKDGLTMSPISVRYMLDQNPSYAQLCEMLERKGFALDRRRFAQALLYAVPDLSSNPTPKPPHPADHPRSATKAPNGLPSQDPQRLNGPSGNIQAPVKPPPTSVSKHEKARKRNFSEIIDLSQDQSDDDDGRRRSIPQHHPASVASLKTSGGPLPGANAIAVRPSRRDHVRVEVVVQPLNMRRDAVRRSSYDPRTICRDILISCGKHPSEAPLNAHLNILRERFNAVNYESDLKTLRWDMLDPEEENLEESEQDDAETGHQNISDENPAPELSFVKEEAAREDPAPMSSSGNPNPPVIVQISPNTTPSRRGRPPRNSSANPQNSTSPSLNTREQEPKAPAVSLDKAAFIRSYSFTPAATSNVPLGMSNPPSSGSPGPYATANSVRVPGRKGRPPGAKNKNPRSDKGIPKKRPMQFEAPGSSSPSHPTPLGSATKQKFARPQNASSPSAGISIVLPTRSPSVAQSYSSLLHRQQLPDPSRQGSPGVDEAASSSGPRFETHKCRWEGCPAELHNLETLWKHIRKHRTRLEKPYTCKWVGCSAHDGGGGRFRAPDMEAWDKHMETEHLLRSSAQAS